MKSELLFSATAGTIALMLSSCSADIPVANNTSDGAITYSVTTANQTRAAHSYESNNLPDKFRVWATLGDKIYINGDLITKQSDTGNTYVSDPNNTRYWPANDNHLSFYAVVDGSTPEESAAETAGAETNSSSFTFNQNKTEASVNNYSINHEATSQLDLMYAVAKDVASDNVVSLNFRHALSQICFKAQNENAHLRIIIKSITVGNIVNSGTYKLPSQTTDNSNDNNSGTHGSWQLSSETDNYTITFDNGIILDGQKTVDLTTEDITKRLNLLPQKRGANTTDETVSPSLRLNLIIDNKNAASDGYTQVFPKTESSNTNTTAAEPRTDRTGEDVTIAFNPDWEEGNRYIYTLKIKHQNEIKYTATIDDFQPNNLTLTINGHEAALMRAAGNGKSALYFAKTNIDADTYTDSGRFFWWGDIKGHQVESNGDGPFNLKTSDSFNFSNGNINIATNKDRNEIEDEYLNGDILKSSKDAAMQNWGDPWRMPTKEELEWLANSQNCSWTSVCDNNILIGYKVVSNTTGGTIYLPATGCFQNGLTTDNQFKNMCWYWSATIGDDSGNEHRAYRLKADQSTPQVAGIGLRYNGFPIRPVSNGPIETPSSQTDPK